jgi:2-methylisocitrate lyase-like PEP mutase family enzyme
VNRTTPRWSDWKIRLAGVKRVSLATSLYRAAMSGLVNAAREVQDQGTFGYVEATMATPELNSYTSGASPRG